MRSCRFNLLHPVENSDHTGLYGICDGVGKGMYGVKENGPDLCLQYMVRQGIYYVSLRYQWALCDELENAVEQSKQDSGLLIQVEYSRHSNQLMAEIKFEIKETNGVPSESTKGLTKELNLVSWNNATPKYDIREWARIIRRWGKV